MTFFSINDYTTKYGTDLVPESWQIEMACEMIYSQVGLTRRRKWTEEDVPKPIKDASMEQCRFILDYEIPVIDYKGKVKAGEMESELSSDYSTLALRILSNHGYLYRGVPLNYNMNLEIGFDN